MLIILIWLLYGPLAELLFHVWHLGTIYKGDTLSREVAFTFDDGPHPDYTPELLDLLDRFHVQALFFVVGEHAQQYPEVLRAISERGHLIGSHTYHHPNAWFVTPWRMRREMVQTNQAIEAATGSPVHFFRPPWGRFNLILPFLLKQQAQTPVLWSFAAHDWARGDRALDIAQRISKNIQNGSIILMHDNSGVPFAPTHSLRALEVILPRLQEIGFTFNVNPILTAFQATRQRRGYFPRLTQRLIHPLWSIWECVFDRLNHVYAMSRIFRMSVVPWRFGPRYTEITQEHSTDRTTRQLVSGRSQVAATREPLIRTGTPMIEVHLQNVALQELVHITSQEKMAVRALRELRTSLDDVARAMIFDDRFRHTEGIFGVTLLNRGFDKLGFHIEPVEQTLLNRWIGVLLRSIMILNHPEGRRRFDSGFDELQPRLVWMDRHTLLERYYKGTLPETVLSVEECMEKRRG